MEFYGNGEVKRVCLVYKSGTRNKDRATTKMERYLKSKDLFWDYVEQNSDEYDADPILIDVSSGFKKAEHNGKTYWYGKDVAPVFEQNRVNLKGLFSLYEDAMFYFVELPGIYTDKDFRWKKNKKYNALETVLKMGEFEFYCVYRNGSDDVVVDVRYAKCQNKHRNKVTITTINVYNASNEGILEAIKEWEEEFSAELNEIRKK